MKNNPFSTELIDYSQLLSVRLGSSSERLVDVKTYDPTIIAQYEKTDMEEYTPGVIVVRDTVAKKVALANSLLATHNLRLRVVYGYRHPVVQERYFANRLAALRSQHPTFSDEQLKSLTHTFVAVPEVAGHPTGGAVDITFVTQDGQPCDFGTGIADYSDPEKIKTFASGLTETQRLNRARLHDAMVGAGFVPFYGEWWHFCYGDREWAALSGEQAALYGPIEYAM